MKSIIVAVIAASILASAGSATAASSTSSFTAQTNVPTICVITSSASSVNFGNYDPMSASSNDSGSGSFGFRCTKGTVYRTYISGDRTMISGSERLNFELYSDPGRTSVFPSTYAAALSGSSSSSATEVLINVYGRIPAGQLMSAAAFTQTLTITIDY